MVQHAKDADWPEMLWYLVDEPQSTGQQIEWAKVEYPLFAEACPDEKLLCLAYSHNIVDTIGVPLDVRVGDLWRIEPDAVRRVEERGTQLWGIRWLCQHNTYSFPRHYAGFGLDKMGLHGFAEWTYYGASTYQPYAQIINKEGCYYAYVDEQGRLLSTITWEGAQEGIDDSRYVATLRELINKALASKDPKLKALARTEQMTLNRIIESIPKTAFNGVFSETRADQVRMALAKAILRLIRAGATLDD